VELMREELLDVALLDVIADGEPVPVDEVVTDTQEWCLDLEAWSTDVWPLLELAPTVEELTGRLRFLEGLGMLRRAGDAIEITRAGLQMWDGFPWEYFAAEYEED
jgi:hypothetical protein